MGCRSSKACIEPRILYGLCKIIKFLVNNIVLFQINIASCSSILVNNE